MLRRHVFRVAVPSVVAVYGVNLAYLINGTVLVENVFSLHGFGQLRPERYERRRLGLGVRELPRGLPGSPGRRIDSCVLEDLPGRRRRRLVSRPGQFAVDAPVSPAWVVPRHLQYQRPYRRALSWAAPRAVRGRSSATGPAGHASAAGSAG